MDHSEGQQHDVRAEILRATVDESNVAARNKFASTILDVLINVTDWIAVDSWIGGGKVEDPHHDMTRDQETLLAFRGVATVACMSVELAEAAVTMAARRRYYAVGAVVRQLIECEYLLTLFCSDLDHARRWGESTPTEIRNSFSPQKMRNLVGKFSNEEYWGHCEVGGHPAPNGARLLEKLDPARQTWPVAGAELAIDLGLHLRRIWSAVDALLIGHHVRYERVRGDQRRRAEEAWVTWRASDPVVEALTATTTST
ncbi:hypothetical protein APR04_004946 [Promicromonospora umidemergens]|uniref:AbiV family abortive infection protein n=1 Tax=Promicromonospora umidemergens TaxID=629679 RepID=A0ABP8XUY7_9MICO|nr:hypothetical protein [Promicromonospora umidemergens]MCP2286010.1 hypothetical protein [Promicromonospora umidemergens]